MNCSGYIALHRRVFEHPLFKDEVPFTRREAWVWLIASAAWCPTKQRVGRAVVSLERGELVTTIRELGKTWRWHRSKVERFLGLLRDHVMIRTRASKTVPETKGETASGGTGTIVTLCNYEKFNNSSTGQDLRPRQKERPQPRGGGRQPLGRPDEFGPKESNQPNKIEEGEFDRRQKRKGLKPRHRQPSAKNGTVWLDYGTDEWKQYADDYRDVTGADPILKDYVDGKGCWFKVGGESSPPIGRAAFTARGAAQSR